MLRLPRFMVSKYVCMPVRGSTPPCTSPRYGSGETGSSILITSAPMSASITVAHGPLIRIVRSRMRMPSSGAGISLPAEAGSALLDERAVGLAHVARAEQSLLERRVVVALALPVGRDQPRQRALGGEYAAHRLRRDLQRQL